ncbi:FRG domain-containing protein [Kocuria sp. CCUG 69068]|uniref:FRG domain-containing protein n=1 Tax=Kocuria sp. CCUG 69068 TaxID=2043138 RepID=UPI001E2B9450|nr:FRG domain-containing protein [Kocuria sp. CCUG 69068]
MSVGTGAAGAGPVIEIAEDDLYGLIATLTHNDWQPSGGSLRINVVYRGHAVADRDLDTSLFRLRGTSSGQIEPHILRNFRKYAARDTSPGDSDWNWLSVAQHHGLPTRLLDWSNSPYVALHFATADPRCYEAPGAVWCVDYAAVHELLPDELGREITAHAAGLFTTGMLERVAYAMADFDRFRDAHGRAVPLFFEPPSLDERIVNQAAVFSAMSAATGSLHDWLGEHPELYRKVIIPASLKWRIRDHLDQANMTERVLFPGLDGLSRWLTRYYGPRPEQGRWADPTSPAMGEDPGPLPGSAPAG